MTDRYVLPEEIRLQQCELPRNLNGVKCHQVKLVNISWFADVPFDWRRRVLEGDAMTGHIHLHLLLPLYNLCDRLHPLPHRLPCNINT